MPGKEAQEAPKLLFINAGERGGGKSRQRGWRTIRCGHCADCQYSQSPNFNRSQIHRLRGDELYRPISSQKLIPYQPAPERVWGAEAKARGDGRKERLAWGQLWKKLLIHRLSSGGCHSWREVTHKENQKFLPAIKASGNERWNDWWRRGREVNWCGVRLERESVREGLK